MTARPTTRRRILISCNLAKFGGCETHVYHLSKYLRSHGADVTLAAQTCELNDAWRDDLVGSGVEIVTTPFGWDTRFRPLRHAWAVAAFAGTLRRDYDVLVGIAHGGFHRFLTPFVRPGGWSIYNLVVAALGLSKATLFGINGMQSVITMSPRIARTLRAEYGVRKPMGALPHLNGPSPLTAVAPMRKPVGRDGTFRVAFFGRLNGFKRADLLVRLWRSLDIGPAHLDIYGDGELREPIAQAIAEGGLGSAITMHGGYQQKDAPRLMREADLIVLPSGGLEGLPQVLVEAMAAGVPFVATDVGGMPDLGDDNPDVEICGVGDEDVKRAIERMVARVRKGEIRRDRLVAYARERYAFEVVAEKWRLALFEPDAFFFG